MANLVITLEGYTPVTYSIDAGVTWMQIAGLATLAVGTYDIWLKDAGNVVQIIGEITISEGTVATEYFQEIISGELTEYELITGELSVCNS
jgi:hypothetical protein